MNIQCKTIALLLLLFTTSNAWAFRLSPMSLSLSKSKPQEYLNVENGAEDAKVAIELSATLRVVDNRGKETRPKAEDIKIFPSQFFLAPGEKRRVKIRYEGQEDVEIEKSYRIVAEQLPVEQAEQKSKQSGINILLKYVAALYYSPSECKSDLKVTKVQSTKSKIALALKNEGNCHHLLKNPEFTIKQGTKTQKTFTSEELKTMVGENVLAKSERIFEVPFKNNFKGKLSGSLIDNP